MKLETGHLASEHIQGYPQHGVDAEVGCKPCLLWLKTMCVLFGR